MFWLGLLEHSEIVMCKFFEPLEHAKEFVGYQYIYVGLYLSIFVGYEYMLDFTWACRLRHAWQHNVQLCHPTLSWSFKDLFLQHFQLKIWKFNWEKSAPSLFILNFLSHFMFVSFSYKDYLASRLAPWSSKTLATATLLPRAKKAETFKHNFSVTKILIKPPCEGESQSGC